MQQGQKKYTSLQRVLESINHKEPDQIPYDFSGSLGTGININVYRKLREFLGLPQDNCPIRKVKQRAVVGEDIMKLLKADARSFYFKEPADKEKDIAEEENYWVDVDEWGVISKMPKKEGHYFDMVESPLKGATLEEVKRYKWPCGGDKDRVKGIKEEIERGFKKNRAAYSNGNTLGNGFLQSGNFLCGYEDFMCELALSTPKAEYILDRLLEIKMEFWDMVISELGHIIPIVSEMDDYGNQNALMVSPELYRKYLKPRYKKLFSFIKKKKPDIKIYFHSCGSIYDLIPDLIDVGVDIINPVQVSAKNMDSAKLKHEFGKDLVFWGGGIDTQNVLPNGTAVQVRDEVRRRIEDLAPGGGFVFAPVHAIQSDVPVQNIITMWMTLQEYGAY